LSKAHAKPLLAAGRIKTTAGPASSGRAVRAVSEKF